LGGNRNHQCLWRIQENLVMRERGAGRTTRVDVPGIVATPVVLAQPEPSAVPVDAGSRWQHPDIRVIGTGGC
jgi:hypothetical protein